MPTCSCHRHFQDLNSLDQHQRDKPHYVCQSCSRAFFTPKKLEQHKLELCGWKCKKCNTVFSVQGKLRQHQKSTGHCYCPDCDQYFVRVNTLQKHLQSSLHASHFHCCDCDRDFVNEGALQQHLANKAQHRDPKLFCRECKSEFGTERALQQHQASVVHRPLSNIKCIASSIGRGGCQKRFRSPSSLLHHLESGACPSGITRKKLDAMVQASDVDNIIGSPRSGGNSILPEAIEWQQPEGSSNAWTPTTSSNGSIIFTPAGTATPEGAFSPRMLTPRSDNSEAFRSFPLVSSSRACPLCPSTRRPFSSQESLRQHLFSPAHSRKIFHCPLSFFSAANTTGAPNDALPTRKSFSTLSGLTQHVESGACKGGNATLRKAVEYIESRLTEMGMSKVKLLL